MKKSESKTQPWGWGPDGNITLIQFYSKYALESNVNTLLTNWPVLFPQTDRGRVHAALSLSAAITGPYTPKMIGPFQETKVPKTHFQVYPRIPRLIIAFTGTCPETREKTGIVCSSSFETCVIARLWGQRYFLLENWPASNSRMMKNAECFPNSVFIIDGINGYNGNSGCVSTKTNGKSLSGVVNLVHTGSRKGSYHRNNLSMNNALFVTAIHLDDCEEDTISRIIEIPTDTENDSLRQDEIQNAKRALKPIMEEVPVSILPHVDPIGVSTPLSIVTHAAIKSSLGTGSGAKMKFEECLNKIGGGRREGIASVALASFWLLKEFVGKGPHFRQSKWFPSEELFVETIMSDYAEICKKRGYAV